MFSHEKKALKDFLSGYDVFVLLLSGFATVQCCVSSVAPLKKP